MERLAQSETYYPAYQEGHSGVTGVEFGVCDLTDGDWLDFNDSTFKAAGWTTQYQAMAEDENGLWNYPTGWAIPDANCTYQIQFKVTDGTGTYYADGPKIVVNSSLLDVLADWVNGGRLDLLIDAIKTCTDRVTDARATELDVGTAGKMAYQVDKLMIALANKMITTKANGNVEQFSDAGVSLGSIAGAITSDATTVTRLRMVQ